MNTASITNTGASSSSVTGQQRDHVGDPAGSAAAQLSAVVVGAQAQQAQAQQAPPQQKMVVYGETTEINMVREDTKQPLCHPGIAGDRAGIAGGAVGGCLVGGATGILCNSVDPVVNVITGLCVGHGAAYPIGLCIRVTVHDCIPRLMPRTNVLDKIIIKGFNKDLVIRSTDPYQGITLDDLRYKITFEILYHLNQKNSIQGTTNPRDYLLCDGEGKEFTTLNQLLSAGTIKIIEKQNAPNQV